jgi:hypothetical protein
MKRIDPSNNQLGHSSKGYVRHEVLGDGDCGYRAFRITREKAFELLNDNISDSDVTTLFQPVVYQSLTTIEFYNYLIEKELIQRAISFDAIKINLTNYSRNINVITGYIHYDVKDRKHEGGWAHPVVLQALAHIQKIDIRMWRLGENQRLVPHCHPDHYDYASYTPEGAQQRLDLLYINGNHFERLELKGFGEGNLPDVRDNEMIYPLEIQNSQKLIPTNFVDRPKDAIPQVKIKREFSEYSLKKYNGKQVTEWRFNPNGLTKLQLLYHQCVKGLPRFIHDFFKGRASRDRRGVVVFNQLYLVTQASPDSGGIFIRPNPIYATHEALSNPKQLKNSPEGFALVAWFVHPEQLQDIELKEAFFSGMQFFSKVIQGRVVQQMQTDEGVKDFDTALRKGATETELQQLVGPDPVSSDWGRENSNSTLMERSDSQELNEVVEQRSKIKIKVSILDLTRDDIQMLKSLRKTVIEHLSMEYAVDEAQDDIRMHFHFPYQESTSTLHMHIRINQALHPLDNSRSFSIDDIIKILEQGKDVKNLILERVPFWGDLQKNPEFFLQMNASQEEFSMQVVKNPFKIECQNGEIGLQSTKTRYSIASRIFNKGPLFQPYGGSRMCLDYSCLTENYAVYSFLGSKYGLYLDTYKRLRRSGITPPREFENRAAFFEWIRSCPFDNPTRCANPVIFLTKDQLPQYELDITAFNERTIKTKSGLLAQLGDLGNCIAVIDGNIFIAPKIRGNIGVVGEEVASFNHSSFSSGGAVENSGTLTITNDNKICIDHRSGHYKSRPSKLRALLNLILQKGGKLDDIFVGIWIPKFPKSDSDARTIYYPGRYSSENYDEIRLSATEFLAKKEIKLQELGKCDQDAPKLRFLR